MECHENKFSISTWNIQGVKTKCNVISETGSVNSNCIHNSVDNVMSEMLRADIIFLVESWLPNGCTIQVKDYTNVPAYNVYREKHQRAKRCSGGISLLVKNSINKFVSIEKQHELCLWIKINGVALGLDKDLYLGGIYIPPAQSNTWNRETSTNSCVNPFVKLEEDFVFFQTKGYVIALGDLNARTADRQDFIYNVENLSAESDNQITLPSRTSRDSVCNSFGHKLLQTCNASGMIILNGRINGDKMGNYTSFQPKGCSVVDYAMCSEDIMGEVNHMLIGPPTVVSDHAQVTIQLNVSPKPCPVNPIPRMRDEPVVFKWDELSKPTFKRILQTQISLSPLQNQSILTDCESIDECTSILTNVIIRAADHALGKKKKVIPSKKNKRKWHCPNVAKMEQELRKLGNILRKNPDDNFHRSQFNTKKKQYKKEVKTQNSQFRNKLYNRIVSCDKNNPKEFWRLVNQFKNKKQTQPIDPNIFFEHFKNLNSETSLTNSKFDKIFEKKVLSRLESLKDDNTDVPELDKEITNDEVVKAIKKLPNRKAAGIDGIINEMIKAACDELSSPLTMLFNKILVNGAYPKLWSKGIIVPIHKSGSKADPNNYRGITISSCMGKLFAKLMASRLTNFLTGNNILSEYQIGFRPSCRTSDHVFVLKSIIDHMKKNRKKVFACFIDFRKAFDSVWRDGLLLKLYKCGLGRKFCRLIGNMLSQTQSCVRIGNKVTEYFNSEVGTRQGCNLSPMIFNLFINDLPNLLQKVGSDPPCIEKKNVPILLYADDVVLLSKSEAGLNKALQTVFVFCQKWKLQVNLAKTKVMVFNCKKTTHYKFMLGRQRIEITTKYTYLGVVFTPSGKFRACINTLASKAKRAYNSFKFGMTPQSGCPPKVLIKLFLSLVAPVTLYCADVLGLADMKIPSTNQIEHILRKILLNKNPLNDLLKSFCKFTLQVPANTTNVAAIKEMGMWPLGIQVIMSSLKMYFRAKLSAPNTLLNHAFCAQMKIDQSSATNTKIIATWLNCDTLTSITDLTKKLAKSYENNIKLEYDKLSRQAIANSGKLHLYNQILGPYKTPKYITLIRNPLWRRSITRWRLSSHNLPIERDRYLNLPRALRVCTKCNLGFLGDEEHALFTCKNTEIEALRITFLNKLTNMSPQLHILSSKDKTIYLMNSHDHSITITFAEWLYEIDKLYST